MAHRHGQKERTVGERDTDTYALQVLPSSPSDLPILPLLVLPCSRTPEGHTSGHYTDRNQGHFNPYF